MKIPRGEMISEIQLCSEVDLINLCAQANEIVVKRWRGVSQYVTENIAGLGAAVKGTRTSRLPQMVSSNENAGIIYDKRRNKQ